MAKPAKPKVRSIPTFMCASKATFVFVFLSQIELDSLSPGTERFLNHSILEKFKSYSIGPFSCRTRLQPPKFPKWDEG